MLCKLLVNDHHFSLRNVWKHLALHVNKSLELVHKYSVFLQFFFKSMQISHYFIATKTCPSCDFFVFFGKRRV